MYNMMRDKIFLIVSVNDYGYICLKDNLKYSILFFLSFFLTWVQEVLYCPNLNFLIVMKDQNYPGVIDSVTVYKHDTLLFFSRQKRPSSVPKGAKNTQSL